MVLPRRIREKVLEYYFNSPWRSIDWIAKELTIPKSSVFNIVRGKKIEDPDFLLVRFLVTNLNKEGIDVPRYASAIHISILLDEYGIEPEAAERMMEELLTALYKERWPVADAIDTLRRFDEEADEWGQSALQYALDRINAAEKLKEYNLKIEKQKTRLATYVQANEIVPNNFKYFNKRFGVWFNISQMESDMRHYKQKYELLLKESQLAREGRSIDEGQLHELNKNLVCPITEEQVLEKIDDIRHNPARYWHLFEEELWEPPISHILETRDNEKRSAQQSDQMN